MTTRVSIDVCHVRLTRLSTPLSSISLRRTFHWLSRPFWLRRPQIRAFHCVSFRKSTGIICFPVLCVFQMLVDMQDRIPLFKLCHIRVPSNMALPCTWYLHSEQQFSHSTLCGMCWCKSELSQRRCSENHACPVTILSYLFCYWHEIFN